MGRLQVSINWEDDQYLLLGGVPGAWL